MFVRLSYLTLPLYCFHIAYDIREIAQKKQYYHYAFVTLKRKKPLGCPNGLL